MSTVMQVYKCAACGLMAEVIRAGASAPQCCGGPMEPLSENTTDAAVEKHVPVIREVDGGVEITVGSASHPMDNEHFIEWIEVISGDKAYRRFLKPGETPEAFFPLAADEILARAFCNLHGLWKA